MSQLLAQLIAEHTQTGVADGGIGHGVLISDYTGECRVVGTTDQMGWEVEKSKGAGRKSQSLQISDA